MKSTYWTQSALFLHAGLALTVTIQLFVSLVMGAWFPVHMWVGFVAFWIVILHWIHSYYDKKGITSFKHLFPYGPKGLLAILRDLKNLCFLRLPAKGAQPGLPGLVHGLGLLAVTGMAFSGILMFIEIIQGHPLHGLFLSAKHLHSFIGPIVWAYWIGHLVMALAHEVLRK